MKNKEQFSLLRTILKMLGFSHEAINHIIERINDFFIEKDQSSSGSVDFAFEKDQSSSNSVDFPYHIRDDFLSPAEHSFFMVLQTVVKDQFLICPKIGLGDLFFVKAEDPSEFRGYTNKIDRKHVDFVLCDPQTGHPIVAIELDDKSHQQANRQERDEFVEKTFTAAKLPLLRVPARRAYMAGDLSALLKPYLNKSEAMIPSAVMPSAPPPMSNRPPLCPKCGSEMVLRTAKSGTNQGKSFWGCPHYPQCHGVLAYTPEGIGK